MATLRLTSSTELAASFVWGNDLSGSEQGAGGVGGLLFARIYPANNYNYAPPTVVYYGYDGNGNVTTLYNPASQSVAAVYEYDAFGQILRQTGPTAATNTFRFSTKFTDDESGLNYYGFRYYSPWMGRWLSRDPIGERGGRNLVKAANNALVNYIDVLGMAIGDVNYHHWFPQNGGRGKLEFALKCPKVAASGVDIDDFTTPLDAGYRDSNHSTLHYDEAYNARANEIYKKSKDCCQYLAGILALVKSMSFAVSNDEWNVFTGEPNYYKFKSPHYPTPDSILRLIKRFCCRENPSDIVALILAGSRLANEASSEVAKREFERQIGKKQPEAKPDDGTGRPVPVGSPFEGMSAVDSAGATGVYSAIGFLFFDAVVAEGAASAAGVGARIGASGSTGVGGYFPALGY